MIEKNIQKDFQRIFDNLGPEVRRRLEERLKVANETWKERWEALPDAEKQHQRMEHLLSRLIDNDDEGALEAMVWTDPEGLPHYLDIAYHPLWVEKILPLIKEHGRAIAAKKTASYAGKASGARGGEGRKKRNAWCCDQFEGLKGRRPDLSDHAIATHVASLLLASDLGLGPSVKIELTPDHIVDLVKEGRERKSEIN